MIGCDLNNEVKPEPSYAEEGNILKVEPNYLVLSREDYTVKYKDGYLSLSRDGGKTFHKSLYVDKEIKHIHVFEDESLFFADHDTCYYSHDWESLYESTVLDIEGAPFIPAKYNNFTMSLGSGSDTHRQIIDGQELLVWGNYCASTAPGYSSYSNINVWYTTDKGVTVRSAYKFREDQDIAGNFYTRHIHHVNFNPADNTFWVQTGDFAVWSEVLQKYVDQRHVMKGTYDIEKDEWHWNIVGSGRHFKWCWAVFIDDNIYFAWDVSDGGIVRVPYNDAGDIRKHDQVLNTGNDTASIVKSHTGELIAIYVIWGGDKDTRNFYYSPEGDTWYLIETGLFPDRGSNEVIYLPDMSTDNWGRVRTTSVVYPTFEKIKTVFLDEFIREKFPNAFPPIAEFELQRKISDDVWEPIEWTDDIIFKDKGPFKDSVDYFYRVRQHLSGKSSKWSNIDSVNFSLNVQDKKAEPTENQGKTEDSTTTVKRNINVPLLTVTQSGNHIRVEWELIQ